MHRIFFGVKKVHLSTLAVSRTLLFGSKLTPARFDMMRIIELHPYGVPQSKIQYLLGVSAPTVSRMLGSLEELGFVVRERMACDARHVFVQLTECGRDCIERAREFLIDSGLAERLALLGLGLDRRLARPAMKTLQGLLSTIRRSYGDPSPYEHPWRAEELVPYRPTTLIDGRLTAGTG